MESLSVIWAHGGECISETELAKLLGSDRPKVAYDGFEPSGRMHLAQGLLKKLFVERLTENGFEFIFWVADWFAQMNNKFDGDLNKIQLMGRYFIEIWKALGMNMDKVRFVWASETINSRPEYWQLVMKIMSSTSIHRMKKCLQIQGRTEDKFEELPSASLLYAAMQCADIFFLKANVCQLGLDQRKVNMLARELAPQLKQPKPIILSHAMVPSLAQPVEVPSELLTKLERSEKGSAERNDAEGRIAEIEIQNKMSKSKPDTAIFMDDSAAQVKKKINRAWCPLKEEGNPVLTYFKQIVFPIIGAFDLTRRDQSSLRIGDFNGLRELFLSERIHPADLKACLIDKINLLLEPVRQYFIDDPEAAELQKRVFKICNM